VLLSLCCSQVSARIKINHMATCPDDICIDDRAKEWSFGGRCISCAEADRNFDRSVVPAWTILEKDECVECNPPIYDGPILDIDGGDPGTEVVRSHSLADGGITMTWTEASSGSSDVIFTVQCSGCTSSCR